MSNVTMYMCQKERCGFKHVVFNVVADHFKNMHFQEAAVVKKTTVPQQQRFFIIKQNDLANRNSSQQKIVLHKGFMAPLQQRQILVNRQVQPTSTATSSTASSSNLQPQQRTSVAASAVLVERSQSSNTSMNVASAVRRNNASFVEQVVTPHASIDAEPDHDIENKDDEEDGKCKWSDQETHHFLDILVVKYDGLGAARNRGEFLKGLQKQMKEAGFREFTVTQVDNKLRGLKKTYKNYNDKRNKTGMGAVKKPKFLDLLEMIFGDKPEMNPIATVNSSGEMVVRDDKKKEKPETKPKKRKSDYQSEMLELKRQHYKSQVMHRSQAVNLIESMSQSIRRMQAMAESNLRASASTPRRSFDCIDDCDYGGEHF